MSNDDTKHIICPYANGKTSWDIFLEDEWPKHRKETVEAMKKIDEMHAGIVAIRNDTKFLPTLNDIAASLRDMNSKLFEVLSGKNVVDVDTMKDILKAQQSGYLTICKIFGILFLVIAGLKVFLPQWFGG